MDKEENSCFFSINQVALQKTLKFPEGYIDIASNIVALGISYFHKLLRIKYSHKLIRQLSYIRIQNILILSRYAGFFSYSVILWSALKNDWHDKFL